MDGGELLWKRTLGRPLNYVTLPDGWMFVSVSVVTLRFTNTRNGDLDVTIRGKKSLALERPPSE